MPNVEIDEVQLATLRNVAGFVEKGLANPKTRRKLLEAQKELYPGQAIPELDAADPILEEMKSVREELQKDREARAKEAAERADAEQKSKVESDWLKGRQKLVDARLPEESIGEIEKLMHERNIFDHEAAHALYERLNPPPEPVLGGSSRFEWFDGPRDAPDIKALWDQDYDGFLRQAIPAARREFRTTGQ